MGKCACPDPTLCERLGTHLFGTRYRMYHTRPDYRAKWEAEAAWRVSGSPPGRAPTGDRRRPCQFEGRIITPCHSVNPDLRHVRDCEKHGQCTRGFRDHETACCAICPDYQPGAETVVWISLEKLARDTVRLGGMLPRDVNAIGGIVRSGMIPASILATLLHLPLYEVGQVGAPRLLRHGGRGVHLLQKGRIFVVDDTVYNGTAIRQARVALGNMPALFGAVYVRNGMAGSVNYYAEQVPDLHVLEWNWANCGPLAGFAANPNYEAGLAADLDGILCHDELSGGRPGDPYMIPRKHPIPCIATGRPESTRPSTEAWLRDHEIQWKSLDMLPDGVTLSVATAAHHKARSLMNSRCGAFIESCPDQAREIHAITGRPVICPRAGKVFQ